MMPEAQQIAIAEAWVWEKPYWSSSYQRLIGRPPKWDSWPGVFLEKSTALAAVPDYLKDLNAMHGVEQILTALQCKEYVLNIMRTTKSMHVPDDVTREDIFQWLHATAAQRAEAFLKTVGKWDY